MVSDNIVKQIGDMLLDQSRPLKERFRALFSLKNIGGSEAINCISSCFTDPSALLKHELAYCLGQMQDKSAISILKNILADTSKEAIVRHEAGEALGAIGDPECLDFLQKYTNDPITEVAETCQLAIGRIEYVQREGSNCDTMIHKNFHSIDPTPFLNETNVSVLEQQLLDESLPLFDRYRAMFSLRNLSTCESATALAKGFQCSSHLFKHEIGYVLGQVANPCVVKQLSSVVEDVNESEMVRHEAAEALGAIANTEAIATLNTFTNDPSRIVRESCEVALDMCDYENSFAFKYADALNKVTNSDV